MEHIQEKLQELLYVLPDLLENERKLKSALKDIFPKDKLAQNLLYMIVEAGLVRNAETLGHVDKFSMHGYVKCLMDDYGVSGRTAKDYIVVWLNVLGLTYEDIVVEEPEAKPVPVVKEPEPVVEPEDPLKEEKEENQRIEDMVREYNALLYADMSELEEQSTIYCFQYLIQRLRITDAKFWVDGIKKKPGTADWWSVCWKRSRYWALPLNPQKFVIFPNPKLVREGRMHTLPRLNDFFHMITTSDDFDRCVKAEPAVLTTEGQGWKIFSGGILYIG